LRTGLATGTEGYFVRQDDFAIMVFRGTEQGDSKDSFTDLSLLLVPEPDYSTAAEEPQKALRHLSFIESLFHPSPCKVHHGFQFAVNDVWKEVHQYLWDYRKAHPHSEIVFTGHSLWAAQATLAVSRFGGGNASLYTFGCPRTGNGVFCQRVVNQADQGVFRFVNGNDPVTHVPPEDLGYRHTSPLLRHIDYEGISRSCLLRLSGIGPIWPGLFIVDDCSEASNHAIAPCKTGGYLNIPGFCSPVPSPCQPQVIHSAGP
jgi:hypothetical protein